MLNGRDENAENRVVEVSSDQSVNNDFCLGLQLCRPNATPS